MGCVQPGTVRERQETTLLIGVQRVERRAFRAVLEALMEPGATA